MGSNLDNTVPTARIKFPSFNLSSALEADNNTRMAAEDAGEFLDDGEIEFEDEDEGVNEEVKQEACAESVFAIDPFNNSPSMSRNNKKYAKLTKRSRKKRAAEAVKRIASRGIKPFVVELAKGALPLELEDFDASTLPVSSSGWNANPRKKLSPGLQSFFGWDGQSCVALVDTHDRIIAVLGGVPHGSKGEAWRAVEADATAAAMLCHDSSTFTETQKHGRRGDFASPLTNR
ncbi:hypothetical protein LENED_010806 [Lentinula edodes]|uniref:Uncharacterized protein n=1 Tax=Lentinula edodes TaxID=5353 RepID=A0A1Q3ENF3_LENED|nr:hypothetical protein LENED_010806 [Lentinula edodes]